MQAAVAERLTVDVVLFQDQLEAVAWRAVLLEVDAVLERFDERATRDVAADALRLERLAERVGDEAALGDAPVLDA